MRLYWGCYWRALLFVLAQIVIMVPLTWIEFFGLNHWMGRSESVFIVYVVATETLSVLLGFGFVALYVRFILGRRIGHVRFVLVTDAGQSNAMGAEAGRIPGAA